MKSTLTILLVLLLGCSEVVLDFPPPREVLVVEGWITNESKAHWVKLSYTTPFEDTRSEKVVNDATVWIEQLGSEDVIPMIYDGNGYYRSAVQAGLIDARYRLNIELADGTTAYSSFERLNPVSEIEQINFDSFEDEDPDTGEEIEVIYPVVHSTDPAEEVNFYRYRGFRNGEILNAPQELIILSDQFVNGRSLPHNIPEFRLDVGDEVTIHLESLSAEAFGFLELLKIQTTTQGSSGGIAPAPLKGNLRYDEDPNALIIGFFGASSVTILSATVSE